MPVAFLLGVVISPSLNAAVIKGRAYEGNPFSGESATYLGEVDIHYKKDDKGWINVSKVSIGNQTLVAIGYYFIEAINAAILDNIPNAKWNADTNEFHFIVLTNKEGRVACRAEVQGWNNEHQNVLHSEYGPSRLRVTTYSRNGSRVGSFLFMELTKGMPSVIFFENFTLFLIENENPFGKVRKYLHKHGWKKDPFGDGGTGAGVMTGTTVHTYLDNVLMSDDAKMRQSSILASFFHLDEFEYFEALGMALKMLLLYSVTAPPAKVGSF